MTPGEQSTFILAQWITWTSFFHMAVNQPHRDGGQSQCLDRRNCCQVNHCIAHHQKEPRTRFRLFLVEVEVRAGNIVELITLQESVSVIKKYGTDCRSDKF